jgi:hypothetical protein
LAMVSGVSSVLGYHLTYIRIVGKEYTKERFSKGICRLDIYKQWWFDCILEIPENDTLVVMQSEDVKSNYRDDAPPYISYFSPLF